MLRRLAVTRPATSTTSAVLPQLRTAAATKYAHMSEPIGQGKVMPLKFDYLRPAYSIPTMAQYFVVMFAYIQTCFLPNYIMCFLIVFTIHGGWTGHLPPNPQDLHK